MVRKGCYGRANGSFGGDSKSRYCKPCFASLYFAHWLALFVCTREERRKPSTSRFVFPLPAVLSIVESGRLNSQNKTSGAVTAAAAGVRLHCRQHYIPIRLFLPTIDNKLSVRRPDFVDQHLVHLSVYLPRPWRRPTRSAEPRRRRPQSSGSRTRSVQRSTLPCPR